MNAVNLMNSVVGFKIDFQSQTVLGLNLSFYLFYVLETSGLRWEENTCLLLCSSDIGMKKKKTFSHFSWSVNFYKGNWLECDILDDEGTRFALTALALINHFQSKWTMVTATQTLHLSGLYFMYPNNGQ